MQNLRMLALALVAAASASAAMAQYPERPVTMIVPFPPGGVADTVARPVAEALGAALKQPVVIENRAGAGGAIGMAHVAKSKPDGYTVLLALSSLVVLPEADQVLGRAPAFQVSDLKPVSRFTADPTVLVVRADSPWKTYAEFIAAAKAAPGKLNFGSSGNYGTMHIPMAMLMLGTDVKMTHVPYTGAGPAIVGLLGGQVDALATGPATIVQHVQAGKLRALAHWGEGRLASLPDVPSLKELGLPIVFAQWSGLFVPAETPESIVGRLREAGRAAGSDPKVREVLLKAGSPVLFQDAPDFQKYVDADARKMVDVVKRIGKVE